MHKVVLVGAGRIGHIHARNAAHHPRIELAGIVDAVDASAQALAREYGSAVTGLDAALGDASVADGRVAAGDETRRAHGRPPVTSRDWSAAHARNNTGD